MHCSKRRQERLAYAASNAWPPLNLSFQCLLLLWGQRTAYQIAKIVDADYLALRVENGTYGARAIIPLYVGRNADIVCPALNKDRGGAADLLHDSINQAEIVIHLRGAKKYGRHSITLYRISTLDFRRP